MRSSTSILVFASLVLFAREARAHLDLLSPTPRTTSLKSGPCGAGPNDPRGPTVATFKPGETITVTWNEYVDHPGHYRVAFDADGQDGFFDPKDFNDVSGGPGVLVDGIADKQGGDYSIDVQLPNIECDNCVLQVIQMMTDKPPYGDGNDLYYQCADIALVGVVEGTGSGEPASTGSGETGGTAGETGGTAGETGGAGSVTGDQPTSAGESSGAATGTGAETGGATGTDTGSGSGTGSDATTDGASKDSGCGCRSDDAGGPGWLAVGLLLPLLRRRRAG
jgi:MYXO-CTERM domain-containing protein